MAKRGLVAQANRFEVQQPGSPSYRLLVTQTGNDIDAQHSAHRLSLRQLPDHQISELLHIDGDQLTKPGQDELCTCLGSKKLRIPRNDTQAIVFQLLEKGGKDRKVSGKGMFRACTGFETKRVTVRVPFPHFLAYLLEI